MAQLKVNTTIGNKSLLDYIHPVGTVYETTSSTFNPSTAWGGTWERIKGRVLVGVDENDSSFQTPKLTGGEKVHTLVENELPIIDGYMLFHGQENGTRVYTTSGHFYAETTPNYYQSGGTKITGASSKATVHYKFGGGASHNNMPPYYTIYIWERTA